MSRWMFGLVAAALVAAPSVADDAAVAVVKKAIDAHGGADALNKYKAGTYAIKGTMSLFGTDLDFTGDIAYQLPDKFRMTLNADVAGQKLNLVQVVNGKAVSNTMNGQSVPVGDPEKAELAQAAAMQDVSQLTPLLDGKTYELKAEKDADVGGKPAAVVEVSGKTLKPTRLYFDKGTGLLVKTSRNGLSPGGGAKGKEVLEETVLAEFKKFSGIMVPTKMTVTHDGKPFMAATVTDAKLTEKGDPKSFAVDD